MEREEKKACQEAAKRDSGVATDIALNDEVSKELVDEETKTLNNNPRNDDL